MASALGGARCAIGSAVSPGTDVLNPPQICLHSHSLALKNDATARHGRGVVLITGET